MSINVLHIVSGSVREGASKGAIYLHKYLLNLGINSKVLINSIDEIDDIKNVHYYKKNIFEKFFYYSYKIIFKIFYNLFFIASYKYIFTSGFYGVNIKKNLLFKEADIIHLHSIHDFISLKTIQNINKPIIWTIRDWWVMTGGCHVPKIFSCTKYNKNCNKCDQLNSSLRYDISFFLHKIKKNNINKLDKVNFIAISDNIKKDFQYSYPYKKIDRIYNITDEDLFYPDDSIDIRKTLKINTSKKIILFGASRISDPCKGSQYLNLILKKLDPKKFFIVSFGVNDKFDLSHYKFDHIDFDEVNDPNLLRKIYSVSNLFICTSIQESFGKTVLESLLCSTPVVAFNVGGINEIILHRKNGFLAKPFDIDDFICGINYILDKEKLWGSKNMVDLRLNYLKKFSHLKISKDYLNKYNKLTLN